MHPGFGAPAPQMAPQVAMPGPVDYSYNPVPPMQGLDQPPPVIAFDPNEFRNFYRFGLQQLHFNNKLVINDLTTLAKEFQHRMSVVVSKEIELHIKNVSPVSHTSVLLSEWRCPQPRWRASKSPRPTSFLREFFGTSLIAGRTSRLTESLAPSSYPSRLVPVATRLDSNPNQFFASLRHAAAVSPVAATIALLPATTLFVCSPRCPSRTA